MTITYSLFTSTRLSNQAAPFVSSNPSVLTRSSPRFAARELREALRLANEEVARQAREIEEAQKELCWIEHKAKNKKRFRSNRWYRNLLRELHNLRDEFGLNSKHHTYHSNTISREESNLACPPSYYSFNPKTDRANRQARRTNLYSQPNKRQRTHQ